jgi:hypothetical protein
MVQFSTDKDLNKMARELVRAGWTPIRRKRHYQLISPCLKIRQTIPSTPGDFRSFTRFRADVQRIQIAERA